jgi:hypothetical protein
MQHQAGQPPSYTNYRPKCPQKHQPFGVFCIRQKDDIPPGQVANIPDTRCGPHHGKKADCRQL